MKKRNVAVIMVLVFTLGLMLTPVRTILADPVIRVISDPTQYLAETLSGNSTNDTREDLFSESYSDPLVTFSSGDSITIPQYVDNSSDHTQATVTIESNNNETSLVSSDTQTQLNTEINPASELDIQTQAVTQTKTTNKKPDIPQVKALREIYNNSPAHALVGRAIWYMNYGYMVYGHKKYWDTGYIDCSNFVSLVYKDFGYNITSAARKYNTVGRSVSGVYSKHQPGTTKKYMLVGVDKLKPGDILTFWKEDSAGKRYIGHVAIYMGKLNGKPTIIHTVKGYPTAIGITTSFTYWYGEHFNGARRVLGTAAYSSKTSYSATGPVIPEKYQMNPGRVVMPGYLPNGF